MSRREASAVRLRLDTPVVQPGERVGMGGADETEPAQATVGAGTAHRQVGECRPFMNNPGYAVGSPSASRKLFTARIQSIWTAGRERLIRSATSANGSRSRLRRTITSW